MNAAPFRAVYATPLGPMTATADADALRSLWFTPEATPDDARPCAPLEQLEAELAAYFVGELTEFATPIDPHGSPFQRSVWDQLLRIPFGETRSYAAIARTLGNDGATRAVGTANGANPLAIVVPCHRVVRTGGALGGYAGGLEVKRWLLDHELRHAGAMLFA